MPGRIIKEILIDTHYCQDRPKLWRWKYLLLDHGTQWQCDECNAIWEVERSYDPFSGWSKQWIRTEKKSSTRRRDHV